MRYEEIAFASYRIDEEGDQEQMANFVAEITKETRIVDGMNSQSRLQITGRMAKHRDNPADDPEPVDFPMIEIDSEQFTNMAWVMPNWGVKAIIRPGAGIKDDLRTFIQMRSSPEIMTIYRHTGWTKINKKDVFLHAGGGITAKGNDPTVSVRLPMELSKYNLATEANAKTSALASLDLIGLADKSITWPLLAATIAPVFGAVDFAIHLAGRTGTYKSELVSLFQSHFGADMDARNLPGSWSSTANALEAQSFMAKNAAFVVDDFVPQGSAWQVRAYQQNADKIIRAQGNQAGRARLTDASALQQTMYPRGIIISTGEDIPEGHSVRARMLILELAPGDIKPDALTRAQANRELYPGTIAGLAQFLADKNISLSKRTEELRSAYRDIGHTRTPGMLGRLVATADAFLEYCEMIGAIDHKRYLALRAESKAAIEEAGSRQQSYLEDADPVDLFVATIRQVFAGGLGHVRSLNGGVPANAAVVGWVEERSSGDLPTYKSRGPCIGWVDVKQGELYLDLTAGVNVVKKVAGSELVLTKQTLFKRMKDAGVLIRTDEARQRNTIRITADGHVRQVLCLSLTDTLDTTDGGNDNES